MKYFVLIVLCTLLAPTSIFAISDNNANSSRDDSKDAEIKLEITPAMVKYGGDVTIHASLPSYEKSEDLRYYIDVFDQSGHKVDSTLWFARTDFNYTLRTEHPSFNITKAGDYSINIEKSFNIERTGQVVKTGMFTIITNPPPSKQFKSGIVPKDVVCNHGLELVMKKSNGQPICVKGTSVKTLTLRNYIPEYAGALGGEIPTENLCNEKKNLDLVKIPQIGEPSRLVFFVKQNTTAHICIKYSSNFENEGTLNLKDESVEGFLVNYNGTKSNVSVTINPMTIPLQKGQTTIAEYAISVPHNADGVYWLGVSQLCDRIPIVASNHRIVPDDIPVFVGVHGCPVIMLDAKIIGYSNADAQYHIAKALLGR